MITFIVLFYHTYHSSFIFMYIWGSYLVLTFISCLGSYHVFKQSFSTWHQLIRIKVMCLVYFLSFWSNGNVSQSLPLGEQKYNNKIFLLGRETVNTIWILSMTMWCLHLTQEGTFSHVPAAQSKPTSLYRLRKQLPISCPMGGKKSIKSNPSIEYSFVKLNILSVLSVENM